MNFKEILHVLWDQLDSVELALFASIAWHIWKGRCSFMFDNKTCQPHNTLDNASKLIDMCILSEEGVTKASKPIRVIRECSLLSQLGGAFCWVDGSFADEEHGGAAHVATLDDQLHWYQAVYLQNPTSPFQAEAEALLRAIQAAHSRRLEECTFLSDCQLLVKTIEGKRNWKAAQVVDWRSYHLLERIMLLLNKLTTTVSCTIYSQRR